MADLSGRTVIISGVARGQGRSHALAVARAGGRVVGFDICHDIEGLDYPLASEADMQEVDRALKDLGSDYLLEAIDVRDEPRLRAFVAEGVRRFGGVDGVVSNAGIWDLGPSLWETDSQTWTTVLDVTLTGSWRLLKATAPHLVEQEHGSVVFISSVNGFEPHAGYGSYVVAKHGVIGLMRQAAIELAPFNVRVNAVCPGAIDTRIWNNDMGYRLFGDGAGRPAAIDAVYGNHALAGRSALPAAAISNAVTWLLSDDAEQVTGVALPVDAGHLILGGFNHAPQKTGPHASRHQPPATTPA